MKNFDVIMQKYNLLFTQATLMKKHVMSCFLLHPNLIIDYLNDGPCAVIVLRVKDTETVCRIEFTIYSKNRLLNGEYVTYPYLYCKLVLVEGSLYNSAFSHEYTINNKNPSIPKELDEIYTWTNNIIQGILP